MDTQCVVVRSGERPALYETVQVSSGTATISSATFDFLDNNGVVLASGVAATGFDSAPSAAPRVWYQFDAAAPPGGGAALMAGNYRLKWSIPVAVSGDTLTRIERPSILVVIVN